MSGASRMAYHGIACVLPSTTTSSSSAITTSATTTTTSTAVSSNDVTTNTPNDNYNNDDDSSSSSGITREDKSWECHVRRYLKLGRININVRQVRRDHEIHQGTTHTN